MKRLSILSFVILFLSAHSLLAQQTKQFTLNELIPGGSDYYQFAPNISKQYQWWGDKLIEIKGDSVFVIPNPSKHNKSELLVTLSSLTKDGDKLYSPSFSTEGSSMVRFRSSKGLVIYNLERKEREASFDYPERSSNHSLSPNNNYLAYTVDNNLFIIDKNGVTTALSSDDNKGIVYGQEVHRSEFGISGGIFWSPNGSKVAFYRMDETMVEDYPLVNVSARQAKLEAFKYPMAGMTSHHVTLGVYDINSGNTVYMKTGEPAEHYLTNVAWNPTSDAIYIAEINRDQNHMHLNRYNATTGAFDTTLFEEKHDKYVEPENPVLFVKGNDNQFIWQSVRDGYNHLYIYDLSGNLVKQLTKGDWEVSSVIGFDAKGQNLFFSSTNPTPMDRHLYSVNLKSGKYSEYSTDIKGTHSASLSGSGRYLIDRYSAHNIPSAVDLIDTKSKKHSLLAQANNPFEGYDVPKVTSGTIMSADDINHLHYRMVRPVDFDPSKKYPVAIYVYGGPHSQMVQNRWRYGSGGWELYMAQRGHIVFVLDNRGTSNRGIEFENVTHRQLGVEEVKDQMRGVDFLKSLPYVDADRIGVHGWSYGGFMTINMLLRHPDVFKVGVAGGPVTDWKYYEIMYGERYMDTPQDNPEGYEETSLLNKADKLKSRLLIIHGDEDPVVVMQHSLQFIKSAINAGTHPDFFVYPGHGHNMMGKDRVHLHEHITRYFDDFLK
ncbi:MAG: S9 family peptidase [Proteiniphilum sp.]|nr:S9 family peptidase [Proteiniphilum sp.]